MTRDVIVVPPELPLAAAWAIMERRRIRHLPVVRVGALFGILSDRDILVRSTIDHDGKVHPPKNGLVAEAMTATPMTCEPSTTVADLARMMTEHKIDAVPVVRGLHLLGLVTSTDLLHLLISRDEAERLPFEWHLLDDVGAAAAAG